MRDVLESILRELELNVDATLVYFLLAGLVFVSAVFLGRRVYQRYLGRRLLFEPWINLSNNAQLDVGHSLSELLYFELETIQGVHQRFYSSRGLWNERIPRFEQSQDGHPGFLGEVKLLAAGEKASLFVRLAQFLIFLPQPTLLRGSLHKYGDVLRLQVKLEGRRDSKRQVERARCWKSERRLRLDGDNWGHNIPEMVCDLAHMIYMELADDAACKTSKAFGLLTQGMRFHTDYDDLHDSEIAEAAVEKYQEAITEDGGRNPVASYNIAQILYSKYTFNDNEEAIEHFKNALHTSNDRLRAQAYSGLANALCQKLQRYRHDDFSVLDDAVRIATTGYDILGPKSDARVTKALAYTWQVAFEWLQNPKKNEQEVASVVETEARKNAIGYYEEATELNRQFTVAYNNLGFLFLKIALSTPVVSDNGKRERRLYLEQAEGKFQEAIKNDPTYFDAYDNLGQVFVERAKLLKSANGQVNEALKVAEKWYYHALDYNPHYINALEHLSMLYLHRTSACLTGPHVQTNTFRSFLTRACHMHGKALASLESQTKPDSEEFKRRSNDMCCSFVSEFRDVLAESDERPDLASVGFEKLLDLGASHGACTCTKTLNQA